jgi:hypothetical protein
MADQKANPQTLPMCEVEGLLKARMSLGHLLNDTHPLSNHDYELIGKFVQAYCVADLEMRRVINCLTHIKSGKPTTFAFKLNDKDALDHLISCADSCIWNMELSAGVRRAAEIFVEHRHLRHIFAHWAGRRISGHNVFIFFTSSLSAQKTPRGAIKIEEQEGANIQYAIVPVPHLLQEQLKLEGHAQYLARMGYQLEARATEIARKFSADMAVGNSPPRPRPRDHLPTIPLPTPAETRHPPISQ